MKTAKNQAPPTNISKNITTPSKASCASGDWLLNGHLVPDILLLTIKNPCDNTPMARAMDDIFRGYILVAQNDPLCISSQHTHQMSNTCNLLSSCRMHNTVLIDKIVSVDLLRIVYFNILRNKLFWSFQTIKNISKPKQFLSYLVMLHIKNIETEQLHIK